ncbi:MAG: methylthioadenosine nucleosidase [Polaromonas sp.]|nr:methylthioadenosine nucleosidase [Polaromonas sp.]
MKINGMPPTTMPSLAPVAILSALPQEQRGLINLLQNPRKVCHASRDFWLGGLHGHPVVLALSRIGKVAAATTATALIERFGVGCIIFTGVAGGLGEGVKVGDVVVATDFIQHDMDASPLFPRYQVPLYGKTRFPCDPALSVLLFAASQDALSHESLAVHGFQQASVHQGLIASGDRFVCGAGEARQLRQAMASAGHDVLAVEMEGAAVAQVCSDYRLPFAVMRTISDRADDSAHVDFPAFVQAVASPYAQVIIKNFLELLLKK